MKKLLSLAVLLVVFCSSALIFAGCNSSNGTITFDGTMPYTVARFDKTQYEESEAEGKYMEHIQTQLGTIKFSITYKDKSGTEVTKSGVTIAEARLDGASVTGFSLKTAGTRTAKLAYMGVTAEFTYTVG